jgi:hypothetical protein
MTRTPRAETASQDRVTAQTAKSEKLTRLAQRPDMPWLLGKFVTLEAWRQRPTRIERNLAERTDAFVARSEARSEEIRQDSDKRLSKALDRYRGLKAGEPEIVPASTEVLQVQFTDEQVAAPETEEEPFH